MYRFLGIDPAVKRPSTAVFFNGCSFFTVEFHSPEELLPLLSRYGTKIAAIDAPLSLPSKGGFRDCERIFAGKGALPITGPMKQLALKAIELKELLEARGVEVIESIAPIARRLVPFELLNLEGAANTEDQKDAALMAFIAFLYDWDAAEVYSGRECTIYLPPLWIRKELEKQSRALRSFAPSFSGKEIKTLAAFDVSYRGDYARACAVTARLKAHGKDFEVLEVKYHREKVKLPYVPGFLSARELPIVKKLFSKLSVAPDAIALNGVGINHLRAGLATRAGVELKKPSLGVTKNIFCRDLVKIDELGVIHFRGFPAGIKLGKWYLSLGHAIGLKELRKIGPAAVILMNYADRGTKRKI